MNYSLPERMEVCGTEYDINSDFRVVLDILESINDPDFDNEERAIAAMVAFYPAFIPDRDDVEPMPREHWQEALERCFWFINGGSGQQEDHRQPKLVDWAQDFQYICPAVSKALNVLDIRSFPCLHWWTFLGGFMSMGDCFFAQIVNIRNKRARGKKLDKQEREFYNHNRKIIDIKHTYTQAENDILREWLGIPAESG